MNPWLEIPLEDYEGHMGSASVAQAPFLAESLALAVQRHQPKSIAVLGCAGGNGFEKLPAGRMERVVGVDINPDYISMARTRHGDRFPRLDLFCSDLLADDFHFEPVDLIFAGLLFEYVDPAACLSKIKRLLNPGGHLIAVLQLPNADISKVSPSPFRSLSKLGHFMALVPPRAFEAEAQAMGYRILASRRSVLESGKTFQEFALQLQPAQPLVQA